MPIPFPGMDPWLESPSYWSGIHHRASAAIAGVLNEILPDRYFADSQKLVWLVPPDRDAPRPTRRPDAFVADATGNGRGSVGVVDVAAPVTITLLSAEEEGAHYVQIVDRDGGRVVTLVELVSPSNKDSGPGTAAILAKRDECLRAGTNVIEIDLLRGDRLPLSDPEPPESDYLIMVAQAADPTRTGLWPLSLRDPLPPVPIPLVPPDKPVMLDLRRCLDRAYDDGRLGRRVRYNEPPEPPLSDADAAWARGVLVNAGVLQGG